MSFFGISISVLLSWKPSTISVRLDFLKCVRIFSFFKSVQKTCLDFLISNANPYSNSRHTVQIFVLEERNILTHLKKFRGTDFVRGFRFRAWNALSGSGATIPTSASPATSNTSLKERPRCLFFLF